MLIAHPVQHGIRDIVSLGVFYIMENMISKGGGATLPQAVNEAKAQGHEVFIIASEAGEQFYFRKPTKQEVILFQDNLARSSGAVSIVQEKLLRSLFCGSDALALDAYLNSKPFAVGAIFAEITADMGLSENFTKTTV
ncbi:MAG: hypothetical protein ACRCY4_07085 [Brevinema sp.]